MIRCEHRRITRIKKSIIVKGDKYTLNMTRCTDCGTQLAKQLQEA